MSKVSDSERVEAGESITVSCILKILFMSLSTYALKNLILNLFYLCNKKKK